MAFDPSLGTKAMFMNGFSPSLAQLSNAGVPPAAIPMRQSGVPAFSGGGMPPQPAFSGSPTDGGGMPAFMPMAAGGGKFGNAGGGGFGGDGFGAGGFGSPGFGAPSSAPGSPPGQTPSVMPALDPNLANSIDQPAINTMNALDPNVANSMDQAALSQQGFFGAPASGVIGPISSAFGDQGLASLGFSTDPGAIGPSSTGFSGTSVGNALGGVDGTDGGDGGDE